MKPGFLITEIQLLEKAFLDIEGPFRTELLVELNVLETIEAVA